jgi:hypothetical protein
MSQTTTPKRARQALDAVMYGLAVAAMVFVVGALLGVVLGGGLVTAKFVMFVVGLLMFGYATFQLRPDPPWDTKRTDDGKVKVTKNDPGGSVVNSRDETKFQATVQRIPPLSRYSLPPDDRLSVGAKLFVASLATLAWSFVLETVFGVVA